VLLLVAWLAWVSAARAELAQSPLVVVVSSNPDAPFVRRLAAELSLFGFRVEVAARGDTEESLPRLLEQSRGAALISVDQGKQTAEIVVAARDASGGVRTESERLDPRRRADTNAAVLAERVRARLTELGISPGGQNEAPAVRAESPTQPTAPEHPEKRLWLLTGFGATSGGLGFVPEVSLEVRAFPVRWLSTGAFFKMSVLTASVAAQEGSADVSLQSGGALMDLYPIRERLTLKLGVGALLVSAEMQGNAVAPWEGQNDSVLVPAALTRVGGAVELAPRFVAELDVFIGVCAPRIGVRFAGRTRDSFGQPFAGVQAALAVGVF
jgi:hypothetical protein